mgnify:CR=1 FL=1
MGKNTTWTHLEELILNSNVIDDIGAVALSKNNTWTNLKRLVLVSNTVSEKGEAVLPKNVNWPKELDIWY